VSSSNLHDLFSIERPKDTLLGHPTRAIDRAIGRHRVQNEFTAVFQKVPEGYIGFVEELPGANTQGETLDEARANLEEAVRLVLDANRELAS